ncbi:MAG TPA: hypothetical protein VGI88_15450 [Verrucomicrobiae bacterium]|jgi:hypothetical protein
MKTKTKNNIHPESARDNVRSKMEPEGPVTKRQIKSRVPDAETRLATLPSSVVETPASADTFERAGGVRRVTAARFDLMKLGVQFCPAARAERLAKEAVLRYLRLRAQSAGKKVNCGVGGIVGPKRCTDVRWLWETLHKMADEFAELINEDLERLTEPGADRETLVGMIYTHVLCIRATVTISMGDD